MRGRNHNEELAILLWVWRLIKRHTLTVIILVCAVNTNANTFY
ncbi:hypothetical protein Q427_21955 [Halomonas sp. BC04]|nr:hypothetical protein Q427_21955 [Halomonas sp. BC04]